MPEQNFVATGMPLVNLQQLLEDEFKEVIPPVHSVFVVFLQLRTCTVPVYMCVRVRACVWMTPCAR